MIINNFEKAKTVLYPYIKVTDVNIYGYHPEYLLYSLDVVYDEKPYTVDIENTVGEYIVVKIMNKRDIKISEKEIHNPTDAFKTPSDLLDVIHLMILESKWWSDLSDKFYESKKVHDYKM